MIGSLIVRNRTGPAAEARSLSFQDVFGKGLDVDGGFATATKSGERVDADSATRLTAVISATRLIAEAIASLPVAPFRGTGRDAQEAPRPRWTRHPNIEDTWTEFVDMVLSSALLRGDGLIGVEAVDDLTGLPTEFRPIHPDDVREPERDERTGRVYWETTENRRLWKWHPFVQNGQIIHIRAWPSVGSPKGLSPVAKAKEAIGLTLAAEKFGAGFYGSGQTVSGVIEYPGAWDDDFAKAIKDGWVKRHAGASNAHLPAVLSGGAEWKPLSIPPDQAQFLETRKYQTEEIARLFRVPPHLISAVEKSTSWGSGIEEQGIGFLTYTLLPWIVRLEDAFSMVLPRGQHLRWNVSGLLRGSTKTRIAAYTAGRNGGWLSVNDIREMEDLPPVEDGDDYAAPLNSTRKTSGGTGQNDDETDGETDE